MTEIFIAQELGVYTKELGMGIEPTYNGSAVSMASYLMLSSVVAFVDVNFLINRASSVINLSSFALAK